MNFKNLLLTSALGATSLMAYGQGISTDLPSLSVERSDEVEARCAAIKNIIGVEEDNGYRTNSNCKIIYVNPPKTGKLIAESISFVNQDMCEPYELQKKMYFDNVEAIKNLQERISIEPDTTKVVALKRQRETLKLFAEEAKESVQENSRIVGAYAHLRYSVNWDKLVDQYKHYNDGYAVKKLPLNYAYLTTTEYTPTAVTASNLSIEPLIRTSIPALHASSKELDLFSLKEEGNVYNMGDSLSGQVVFGLSGACPLRKSVSSGSHGPIVISNNVNVGSAYLGSFLIANMTYFYPMITQYGYEVTFNAEESLDIIKSFIKTDGIVEISSVIKEFSSTRGKEAFKVTVIDEHASTDNSSSEETQNLIKEIKQEVIENFVIGVISQIGEPISYVSDLQEPSTPSDPHTMETRSRRKCRKRFLRSSKCWTEHYKVKVRADGTGKISLEHVAKVGMQVTHMGKHSKAILNRGTLTFVQ